jgi:cobalt-zinc-cadmium efflux system protein
MAITFIVMLLEIAGGYFANSLALLSDAGHMFTHLFSLGICLAAIYLASRDPYSSRTYGLYRVEVLAALFNSLFLFGVCGVIVYEAVHTFIDPSEVRSMQMLMVAIIGLAVNMASILILYKSTEQDMNIKAAFAHVMADAVSSVGVVAGALIIHYTDMFWIDPVIALGISVIIAVWAAGLFRDAVNVLLETAPKGMDVDKLMEELRNEFPQIHDVYDLHIWVITTNMYMFSAHMAVNRKHIDELTDLRKRMNEWLMKTYLIEHTTIEFDIIDEDKENEQKN